MTALDLYKFVTKNNLEYNKKIYDVHEGENPFITQQYEVYLFVPIYELEEWNKLLGSFIFEEGINCVMKEKYVCFMMQDICDHFDIDITEIFGKEEENS